MTKETQATTKAPTHFAYQVSKGGQRSFWTRIGIAWVHKDGKGYNIKLDSLPIDGNVILRITSEEE